MIEDVLQIAQEWGGIRQTRPASHGGLGAAEARKALGQDAGYEKGMEVSYGELE
jgi:hypothetical protein